MDTSLGDVYEILVVGDNSRIVSTDLLTIDGTTNTLGLQLLPSVTLHGREATETSQIRMDQHNTILTLLIFDFISLEGQVLQRP